MRDRFLRSCFSAFHAICVYSHFSAGAASPFQHSKKQTPCWARGRAAHSPSHLHLPFPPTRAFNPPRAYFCPLRRRAAALRSRGQPPQPLTARVTSPSRSPTHPPSETGRGRGFHTPLPSPSWRRAGRSARAQCGRCRAAVGAPGTERGGRGAERGRAMGRQPRGQQRGEPPASLTRDPAC